jgi:CelD/BcsL family acetyltransferase involved in cellulose biosynthesis
MNDRLVSSVAVGDEAIAQLGELAAYVDARSVAFSSSSAWLRAAARHLAGTPVVIAVRARDAPVALAVLSVSSRRGARRVELLGGDLNDYGQFFYDDERAAYALAEAVASWIDAQRRWSASFSQLPTDDPVVAVLAARLARAVVEPGPLMPQIAGVGTEYRISKNRRRKGIQATNRIETDGRSWEKVVVDHPEALEQWFPAIVELRRQRDHASGRRSHLDDPAVSAFYEAVVRDAVARGRAAINLLVVDGEVAGFSLAMLDGAAHRLWDGRVAEEFQRYRGGMVCDLMAVSRAVEEEGVTTFDWLRGKREGKYCNHEIQRVELRAASHSWVMTVEEWEGGARRRIKAALPAAAVRRIVAR